MKIIPKGKKVLENSLNSVDAIVYSNCVEKQTSKFIIKSFTRV